MYTIWGSTVIHKTRLSIKWFMKAIMVSASAQRAISVYGSEENVKKWLLAWYAINGTSCIFLATRMESTRLKISWRLTSNRSARSLKMQDIWSDDAQAQKLLIQCCCIRNILWWLHLFIWLIWISVELYLKSSSLSKTYNYYILKLKNVRVFCI